MFVVRSCHMAFVAMVPPWFERLFQFYRSEEGLLSGFFRLPMDCFRTFVRLRDCPCGSDGMDELMADSSEKSMDFLIGAAMLDMPSDDILEGGVTHARSSCRRSNACRLSLAACCRTRAGTG